MEKINQTIKLSCNYEVPMGVRGCNVPSSLAFEPLLVKVLKLLKFSLFWMLGYHSLRITKLQNLLATPVFYMEKKNKKEKKRRKTYQKTYTKEKKNYTREIFMVFTFVYTWKYCFKQNITENKEAAEEITVFTKIETEKYYFCYNFR